MTRVHWFAPRRPDSVFSGPPDETCHHCGCDPRNVIHWSVTGTPAPQPAPTDETIEAQRDRLADMLQRVLKLVDRKQHMFAPEQGVLAEAEALLVEVNG